MDLTVVVADVDGSPNLRACLEAVAASTTELAAEILVVGCRTAWRPDSSQGPANIRLIPTSNALVPELWAEGIRQARGNAVALTTAHMTVGRSWARAITGPLVPPVAGVGGPIDIAPGAGLVDWAVYYLRYSTFLPSQWKDGPVRGDIAGDNAAYLAGDLLRHSPTFDRGFWEIEFHRRLRKDGRSLAASSEACAYFGQSYRLGAFLGHRFDHGRQFGAMRRETGERSRLALVLGAPLVPMLFAFRVARRVALDRAHTRRFVASLPLFLLMAGAWAAGEATGALFGNSRETALPDKTSSAATAGHS